MSIVSPYRNIKQKTMISIEPYHMNADIRNNMKSVLKKKVEKKCNKNGFVDEVYRILEYSDGMMPAENLNGSALFNIIYHCRLCIPIENTIIIAQVKTINQELIIATSGPIMFFVPKENVDTNMWDIQEGYLNKKSKIKLSINNFIKVQVADKRINQNDSQIKAMGKLLDIPTEEEVDKYYGIKSIADKATSNALRLTADCDVIEIEPEIEEGDGSNNFII
jgi:DNA-directed RNA polymerase subunit E'/Rpb7